MTQALLQITLTSVQILLATGYQKRHARVACLIEDDITAITAGNAKRVLGLD